MIRLVIALAAVALVGACSSQGKKPTTGSGEKTLGKRVSLSWGFQPDGEMTEVFLATTDETDKQVSHPIGRYKGKCEKISPAKEMGAITGAGCSTGGGGTELHAVVQGNNVIVMQMGTMPGTASDPMAREEVKQVGVPLGAAIEAAP